MAVDNKIVFGGVDSSTYGIYISGEGVFNAPKRDVEMISIPGRNGAFALDKGRFENITVTYPAYTYETTMATFKKNLSDFRNAIASKKGYQRLTDTFHTDEYRMATFIDGFEIKPVKYNTASEFEISFECKPQRYLTSGETAVTVTSGDTLTNPTLFEASPLLIATGYGNIDLNGSSLYVSETGTLVLNLFGTKSWDGDSYNLTQTVVFDDSVLINGDRIYSDKTGDNICDFSIKWEYDPDDMQGRSASSTGYAHALMGSFYGVSFRKSEVEFYYGTPQTFSGTATFTFNTGTYGQLTGTVSLSLAYDGANSFTISASYTTPPHFQAKPTDWRHLRLNNMYAVATYSNIAYIDLDIGEVYARKGSELISYNNKAILPSDLPTLTPGANTITFDNTITDLKVVSRWWKV